jgi:transmembrane sensor
LNNLPEIEKLFKLYLNNKCSPEEVQLLMHYFSLNENELELKTIIQTELERPNERHSQNDEQIRLATDRVFQNIKKNIRKKK